MPAVTAGAGEPHPVAPGTARPIPPPGRRALSFMYFSRAFKRHAGQAPLAYREHARGKSMNP